MGTADGLLRPLVFSPGLVGNGQDLSPQPERIVSDSRDVDTIHQAPTIDTVAKQLNLILTLVLLATTSCWAATRIAFLPAFSDFESQSPMRAALPAFDARLQAELLNGWNSEVLSRAGLSAVVFEQKLRAAEIASAPALRVLPSDFLVLCILDQAKKQLRVFVNRVGTGMTLGEPVIFPIKDSGEIANQLPGVVARHVARVAGLVPHSPAVPNKPPQGKPLICSLLEPVSAGGAQADLSTISPLVRAVLESVVASDDVKATLVERTQTAQLLDE
ncbi:hypothetical protein HQ447_02415, partial [bacterium]|nr:hypothetical protein [bacterium]